MGMGGCRGKMESCTKEQQPAREWEKAKGLGRHQGRQKWKS